MKHRFKGSFAAVLIAFLTMVSGCAFFTEPPTPPSSEKVLSEFSFDAVVATIDEGAKTVSATVPWGTDVTALKATFAVSPGASVTINSVAQVSAVTPNDFAGPVVYTVAAEDGSTVDYTVTVTIAARVLHLTSGASADVVLGQANMSTKGFGHASDRLNNPWGNPVLVGSTLFVPDTDNHRVLGFNELPVSNATTADFALGVTSADGAGAGTSASDKLLSSPYGLATNGVGIAVADYGNNRVLVFPTIPTASNASAGVVVGQSTMTANSFSGTATASNLNTPTAVWLTSSKLLVADNRSHRVLIWTTLPTTDGQGANRVLGQSSMTTSASAAGDSGMNNPSDVWSDGTRVIVADCLNHRVLIWNTFPTTNGQPADVVLGQPDFASTSPGTGAGGMSYPFNIAYNGRELAVADQGNNRVLLWKTLPTTNGKAADLVLGQPDFSTVTLGTTANKFDTPAGLFLDERRLIVSDSGNNRVLLFNL